MSSIADTLPKHVFPRENAHFIGNKYVRSVSGKTYELVNPVTGRPWQVVSEGAAEDVDAAVQAAEAALDEWQALGYMGRQKLLLKLADVWDEHYKDLALLESATNGTPLAVQQHIIQHLANDLRYHAGWTDKCEGRVVNVDGPYHVYTAREPLGVCGIIGPWNMPLWCVMVSAAPALAAGNTLVIKPSEHTPLSMLRVAELMQQVGFPAGVVNVVCGFGPAGAAISAHMGIAKVAFTGSTQVGRLVMQAAAQSNLKQVHLELGGKSPVVVFPDADLDSAVHLANFAVMNNNGQICTAGSRTFVHADIYDAFVDKAARVAKALRVGDPLAPDVDIGPLVDRAQLERVTEFVRDAKQAGCRMVAGDESDGNDGDDSSGGGGGGGGGGNASHRAAGGFFVRPAVFALDDDATRSRIATEEVFGPVQTIIRFRDVDQVVKHMNNTPYGLAAAVISSDIGKLFAVTKRVKAGTVWVNDYHSVFHNAPFGGFKMSGFGREGGKEGYEQWTQIKTVVVKIPSRM